MFARLLCPATSMQTRMLTALIVLSAVVLFFRLGANRLQSWDEAVYAECAKEMVQSRDYLTPHWNQEKFLQKPPLAIWASAVLFRIFGVSEVAARTSSVLCGIGCVVLTFLIGRVFLSEVAALFAGLILLITPHFNFYARQGSMDVPLTFWVLLAFFAFLKTEKDSRWWILVGVASGLAVLTKGIAAGPLLLAIPIALLIRRQRLTKYSWLGIASLLVIAGSWHVVMLALHGREFFQEYFRLQILNRSASVIDAGPQSPLYFVVILFYGLLPLSILLPFAAWRVWKQINFPLVLLIFAGLTFLAYSIIPTKHPWYIVPIYPVTALALAPIRFRVVLALFMIAASFHCLILDQSTWKSFRQEQTEINRALEGNGPFVTEMNVAPAVLFYSDRKICALPNTHTMGKLANCDSSH
jgi:4-amino-4-deoxy-L-arabinose transferase-like glycosyltransferase